jgi:hypothetical protein
MQNIAQYVPSPPPKWIISFARIGLFAKGVVYCLIGLLAFMAAFELNGSSESKADKQGVFQFVLEQPFGKVILIVIAAGLSFYCLWRLIQALKDTEHKGENVKGLGKRVGFLFSGVLYGGFAVAAFKMALGKENNNSHDGRETLARTLLEQPMGQWLLGLVGLGVIASGFYQIYKGLSNKYKKDTAGAPLKHETEVMLVRAGKVGYVARGIVWILIGYFFIRSAMDFNPEEAGGTGQAFQFVEGTFGSVLLGAIALGLICYGGYMFMRARYQPISTS